MYRCWRKPHSVPDFDKNLTVSERTLIERLHKIVVWNALKSKFEIVLFFSLHLLCLMYYCNGWDWILYNPDFFQARVTITFILEIFHMITDNFKTFETTLTLVLKVLEAIITLELTSALSILGSSKQLGKFFHRDWHECQVFHSNWCYHLQFLSC